MQKLIFFIGTEAELIKIFPLMLAAQRRKIPYTLIASGQNDLRNSSIIKIVHDGKIDLLLSDPTKKPKNAIGLICWFVRVFFSGLKKFKHITGGKDTVMIVHGDTVSTVLGALLGKIFGMRIAHVEAGLRSYDLLNPFPEEIDRIITSRLSNYHFAPGSFACSNLKKARGVVIDTHENTLIDSLAYSSEIATYPQTLALMGNDPYFIFVIHRQENIASYAFLSAVIEKVIALSASTRCIMVLHDPTRFQLEAFGLLETLRTAPNVTLIPRQDYFQFMKILRKAEFVITDGGSNQEELYYMGIPTLLLRKKTERTEGLGENVLLFNGDLNQLAVFATHATATRISAVEAQSNPSDTIIDFLAAIPTNGELRMENGDTP